jgi:hypothetical protein
MPLSRRSFLATGAAPLVLGSRSRAQDSATPMIDDLQRAASGDLLDLTSIRQPVIVESLELLRNGQEFLVRARSRDGAEGVIAPNSGWLGDTYPIFQIGSRRYWWVRMPGRSNRSSRSCCVNGFRDALVRTAKSRR